ncbi:MAG: AAA-like domain-containing protein [Waterburya sp.]
MPQKYNSISWTQFLEAKALELKLTPTQTRVFLTRFKQENWLNKVEDVWQISDVNSFESFVKHSTNIYKILKPYCPDISQGAGNFTIVRDWLLQEFSNFQSAEYSPKEIKSIQLPVEAECYQTIVQPGALIRIKAPSKMGKSRLLNNILIYANQQEYLTVHINLLQIETSRFSSLDRFLRWFCIYITDALKLELNLDKYWNEDRGSMLSCTRYLEMILQHFEQPLVLGLDEVDRLLNYPDISQDFFYLLRSWHEEANNDELWEQLRLVVVYSTEDFGTLDINQSPFNVGLPIELQPFDQQQIAELAISYQLDFSPDEIKIIIKMLGGHPYLVDLLLSYLVNNSHVSLRELLQQVATDTGIYNSYLRQHLINLKSNNQLAQVFLEILNSSEPIQVDTLLAYQLYRMGLIQWSKEGNSVLPSCELYKLYFLPRLTTNV